MIKAFKIDWAVKSLMPEINNLLNSKTNYLERITGLYSLQAIAECAS
jgi:hypothetical protein